MSGQTRIGLLRRRLLALVTVVVLPAAAVLAPATASADGGPGNTVKPNGIKEVVNANGIHEQFTIGGNSGCTVYHRWASRPGISPSGSWTALAPPSCAIPQDGLDVGMNQDGRLEVFATGADNGLWHVWQTRPSSGPWSNWAGLGLPGGNAIIGGPRVTSRFSGQSIISVVVGDSRRRSWERKQVQPNCCSWTNWFQLIPV